MTQARSFVRFSLPFSLTLFATIAYDRCFLTPEQFCANYELPENHWRLYRRQAYVHLRLLLLLCHDWHYPLLPVLLTRHKAQAALTRPYQTQLAQMMQLLGYRDTDAYHMRHHQQQCFHWAKQFRPANDTYRPLTMRRIRQIAPPSDINFVPWTQLPYRALVSKRRK